MFPLTGTLERNLVVDGMHFWYLMQLDTPLEFPDYVKRHVAVRAHKSHKTLAGGKPIAVEVRLIDQVPAIKYAVLEQEQTKRFALCLQQAEGLVVGLYVLSERKA